MGSLPTTATPLAKRVTVDTTADRLDTAPAAGTQRLSLIVRNRGSVVAYVGASDVTTAAGFQLDPGDTLSVDVAPVGGLYAITASSSTTIHVLQVAWT